MLFWTLVFITLTLITLFKGNIFYTRSCKIADMTVEMNKQNLSIEETSKATSEIGKVALPIITYAIAMIIIQITYLINAISIDYLKYPTIIMIALIIIAFVKSSITKKEDLPTEEKQKMYLAKIYANKRTFLGTIQNLIRLSYFGYMFYILVLR